MKDKEKAERQKDERERREIRKRGQSERENFPLEFLHHDTQATLLCYYRHRRHLRSNI